MRFLLAGLLFFALAAMAAQCANNSGPPKIAITAAYALPAVAGANGVVYLHLANTGGGLDTLQKVDTPIAQAVELHQTTIDENDLMRMTPLDNLDIPAGQAIAFEPGGKHLMLIQLKQDLQPGQEIALTLTFAQSGLLTIQVKIADAPLEQPEHQGEH
jgi:hypothetical protein